MSSARCAVTRDSSARCALARTGERARGPEKALARGTATAARSRVHRRYRVDEVIATGGMARIHVGRRRSDRHRVALKVFVPPAGAERRFLDYMVHEAKALRAAASPAVVTLLDHGLWLGRPTLVLEWLEGRTLAETIAASGPLPLDRVEHVMRQLLAAVATLHARGVVHADLKPENVMLCPHAGGERVRIFDLGAAHVDGVGVVARDEVFGTPGYVAPELVDGGAVSASTDVYALGVLLYELLAGQPPFPGAELDDVVHQQTRQRLPRPSAVRGGGEISDALDALVATAMAPWPSRRFPDVAIMRTAFEAAITVTARTGADDARVPAETTDAPTLRCKRSARAVRSAS